MRDCILPSDGSASLQNQDCSLRISLHCCIDRRRLPVSAVCGDFFFGRPCARRIRQNAPCAAVSPVCGSRCRGFASDLTQNVKKRIKARENEDSDRRKRGFLQSRKKAGIKRAVSHRTLHSDRQQPTAISGENTSIQELWRDDTAAVAFRIHTRKV